MLFRSLRTSCRRFAVLLESSGEPDKKLLGKLRELRRRAGKVRDLDVQLEALATLRLPSLAGEQHRVMRRLEGKRNRRAHKLSDRVAEQRARIARQIERAGGKQEASAEAGEHGHKDLLRAGLNQFALAAENTSDDPAALHDFRLACKKARYLVELAGDAQAKPVLQDLRRIQDALGEWFDWELLIASAQKVLGDPERSPLVAALRVQARSHRLHALQVRREASERLLAARVALSGKAPAKSFPTKAKAARIS